MASAVAMVRGAQRVVFFLAYGLTLLVVFGALLIFMGWLFIETLSG